jgi:hypothetical protein
MVHPWAGTPRAAVCSLGTGNSTWQNSRSGASRSGRLVQYRVASLPLLRGAIGAAYSQVQPKDT